MAKNKILKILGAVAVTVLLFFGSAFGTSKIVEIKKFNDLVNSANQKFNTGNYDEAISLYNKALQIKSDNDVIKNVSIAQSCKQYQDIYNQGLKLVTEKKYTEAIQKLNTINQAAGQVYTNAQGKIEECKKNIISEDINATNTAISNKDYDGADKYVEDILKLDANNGNAKQLKTTIAQAQQKDKEESEQRERDDSSRTGNMKGVITWQYNKFIGTKPDTGANVCLISKNKNKNSNNKTFTITLTQHPNGENGIYTAKADGYGNYEIGSVPIGQYYLLIESNNTNSDMTIDSYTYSVLQNMFLGEEWKILQNTLKMNKYRFKEVEIKANKTIIESHDFGYTYF